MPESTKRARITTAIVEEWFEVLHCWTNPGDANDEFPEVTSIAIFSTRKGALDSLKGSKILTKREYAQFLRNGDSDDGYFIQRRTIVFPKGKKGLGYPLNTSKAYHY
jgi:hypothetical protein